MKNLSKLVLKISIMIASAITFCFIPGKITAQTNCFYDPAVVEYSSYCQGSPTYFSPSNVLHTGNDSRGTMEVNVWDGDYPGLSWYENSNPYQGCVALPSGIHDPDVVVLSNYAIVVYADQYNNCIVDVYHWTGSVFQQYTSHGYPYTLQACSHSSYYSTAINIDADEIDDFCIVWDDGQEHRIIAQGGDMGPGYPNLSGLAIVVNGSNFQMPDISLTKRACGVGGCLSEAYCTYVDVNHNELHVDGGNFEDWITTNSCTTYNLYPLYNTISALTGSATFLYPRIACHTYNGSNSYLDWTVVVESYDPGNVLDDIVGFTCDQNHLGNPFTNIYTDGTTNLSPCAIDNNNNERNQFPVVTYNDAGDGIMVGWQSEFSNDGAFFPTGIAAIMCNAADGRWDYSICGSYYLIVPSTNAYHSTYESSLSLSGRDYSAIQYTFYDDNVPDVLYKNTVYGSTCNLRAFRKNKTEDNNGIVFPNPFTDNLSINIQDFDDVIFNIRIIDLAGNELLRITCSKSEINNYLNDESKMLSEGIYFLQVNSEQSEESLYEKLIKM